MSIQEKKMVLSRELYELKTSPPVVRLLSIGAGGVVKELVLQLKIEK